MQKLKRSWSCFCAGVSASNIEAVCDEQHEQMRKLHVQACHQEIRLQKELHVAEIAAILQLAVMWKNKWSGDFQGAYLHELNNEDVVIGEDDFTAVNWVKVARKYIHWAAYGDGTSMLFH